MKSKNWKRVLLVLAGLAAVVGASSATSATTANPDFEMSARPNVASVVRGSNVSYNIAITRSGGPHVAVSLAVSGLPSGATGVFSSDPAGTAAHRTLTVSTTTSATTGTFTLGVTGTSGNITHATQMQLIIKTPPPPNFTLAASPTSRSTVAGTAVTYAVTITRTNLTAPISFIATDIPADTSATFSPVSTTGNTTTLTVQTGLNTPIGTFALVIRATSGGPPVKGTKTVVLKVTKPAPAFTLAVAPANVNVSAGLPGSFTVTITRTRLTAAIGFTVTGVPAHATAAFSPVSTTGNTTKLTVHTTSNTPLGSYDLLIKGTSGSLNATVNAHLTVSAANTQPFTIAGALDRALAPGVTGYLNLALTNPNNSTLNVTALGFTISGTNNPGCTVSGNFSTAQFSGTFPLSIPANSTRTLSQLGVPQSQWPSITMINLSTNQDACKSTGLTLSYTGSGQGN